MITVDRAINGWAGNASTLRGGRGNEEGKKKVWMDRHVDGDGPNGDEDGN